MVIPPNPQRHFINILVSAHAGWTRPSLPGHFLPDTAEPAAWSKLVPHVQSRRKSSLRWGNDKHVWDFCAFVLFHSIRIQTQMASWKSDWRSFCELGLDPRWDPRLDSLVHSRPFEIILPIYSIGRIVFAKKWTNRPPPRPMVTPLVTRWASRPPLHSLLRAQSLTGEIKNSCCDVKREYLGGSIMNISHSSASVWYGVTTCSRIISLITFREQHNLGPTILVQIMRSPQKLTKRIIKKYKQKN